MIHNIGKKGILLAAGFLLIACSQKMPAGGYAATEPTPVAAITPAVLNPEEGTFAFVDQDGEDVGPSPTPSPSPTPAPTPEDIAAAPEGITSYNLDELRAITYSDEETAQLEAFYANTLFTGDSVLLGFKNYCARSTEPMFANLKFLAAGSYSLHNAFWEVSEKSVHPLYQGQQYPLWESIPMIAPERAFFFFGINDVAWGIEEDIKLYEQLIDTILGAYPDLDVTIISATYTLAGAGKGGINNENIRAFNEGAADLAARRGWGYVDMANALSDGQGNLRPEFCSDGFVHETNAAYEVWNMMVKAYAAERMGIREMPKPEEVQADVADPAAADEKQATEEDKTEGTD